VDAGEIGGDGASIRAYGGAGVDVLGARMSGVSGAALCVGGAPGSVEIRGAHLREIGADGVRVCGASVSAQLFEIDGEGIGESGAVVNAASGAAVVISGARLRDIRGVNEARRWAWFYYIFAGGQFRAAISVTGSAGNVEISDIEILRAAGSAVNISNGTDEESALWNSRVYFNPPSASGNVRLVGVRADGVGDNGVLVVAGGASDIFAYDVRLSNLDGHDGFTSIRGTGLNYAFYVRGGNAVYVREAHVDNAPYSWGIRVGCPLRMGSGPAAISVYSSSVRNIGESGISLWQRDPGDVTVDGVVIENVGSGSGISASDVRGDAIVTNVELRNVSGGGIIASGNGGNRTIERITAENVRGGWLFDIDTGNRGSVSISADPSAPFVGTGGILVRAGRWADGQDNGRVDITGVTLLNSRVRPRSTACTARSIIWFLGGSTIDITNAADVNISNVTVDRVYARGPVESSSGYFEYGEPVRVHAEEGDLFGKGIYISSHGNVSISNTAVRNVRVPDGQIRWMQLGGGMGTFPLVSPGVAIWVSRGNAAFANVTVENATGSSAVNFHPANAAGTAAGITFTGQRAREDFTRMDTR